jgi:hypothetical protein
LEEVEEDIGYWHGEDEVEPSSGAVGEILEIRPRASRNAMRVGSESGLEDPLVVVVNQYLAVILVVTSLVVMILMYPMLLLLLLVRVLLVLAARH